MTRLGLPTTPTLYEFAERLPEWFQLSVVLVTGLAIGSFLNVVIGRLPAGESIVSPPSHCPKCQRPLAWFENIPVLSWLVLGGRCRTCRAPISVRYLVVEVLVGLLFVACLRRFGLGWNLLSSITLVSLLVALAFIDAEQWILPFELTLPGIAAGVSLAIPRGLGGVHEALWGAAVGFVSLRAMEYLGWVAFRKEALGGGDKFLFAMLGAFLGVRPLLAVMLLASFQGSGVGLVMLMITGRAGPGGAATPTAPDAASPEGQPPVAEGKPTMTWVFAQPGLPLWRRLVLLPYSIFLQPIPDEPKDLEGHEVEWQPGTTNLPFGPWLALGGLEALLLGPWLVTHLHVVNLQWMFSA